MTAIALPEHLERADDAIVEYISGSAAVPRALVGVLAALGAMNIGAELPESVEACLAGATPGGRFLSPYAGDRRAAALARPTWPFAQRILARDRDVAVRSALAASQVALRPDVAERLAHDSSPRVRRALAASAGALAAPEWNALLGDTADVRRAVASDGSVHQLSDERLDQLLRDTDRDVVVQTVRRSTPRDCSVAAWHRDRVVRLVVAIEAWERIDHAARARLERDPDREVAAAASPALGCRCFVSIADTDAHRRMMDRSMPPATRLRAAESTLGHRVHAGRRDDPEATHAACILIAVVGVVDDRDAGAPDVEAAAQLVEQVSRQVDLPFVAGKGGGDEPAGLAELRRAGALLTGPAGARWTEMLERVAAEQVERHQALLERLEFAEVDARAADNARRARWRQVELDELRRGVYPATRNTPRPGRSTRANPRRPPGFRTD